MEITKERHELLVSVGWYKRPRVAAGIVIVFFLISLSGVVFPSLEEWSARITNRNYNGEGLIELLEAVFWIGASALYFFLLVREVKLHNWNLVSFWFLIFGAFCFVAFGEEISWGQHIFNFEPTETVIAYNKQKEFNFHNLNISEILQLASDNPARRFLTNLTTLLNPLFYLLCTIFWFVIPLLKKSGKLTGNKLISSLPSPAFGTVIFCGSCVIGYLVIDKLLFDVGEIFELSLALVGIMVPLDVLFKDSMQFPGKRSS
jgi:hypothetical protein